MARPLRLEFEHALYHVTSRGDRREDIYSSDEDRLEWLAVLAHVCKRFNWQVYAYCLMSNHYHLLVQTPNANLSAGMRQLNGVYTQRSNKTHGRSGHVFQGRFKAILVDADSYLLELARYIVLNPVRAGMVSEAGQWPWSSYAATIAPHHIPQPAWLQVDAILKAFTPGNNLQDKQRAQALYIDHVRAGVGLPSVWENLQSPMYLGDDKFIAAMMRKLEDRAQAQPSSQWQEVPAAQRKAIKMSLSSFENQHPNSRNQAIQAAYQNGHYSMQAIAQHFGLHYTSVSRILKKT